MNGGGWGQGGCLERRGYGWSMFSLAYSCAAAANKGARVAWVLFEMRTLSKAARVKRDETREGRTLRYICVCIYICTPEGEKQTK